jgi:hypothetical protein
MTTETVTTRSFEVPVILNVGVDVEPDGSAKITCAYPDTDAGPWAYSGDPAAYESDTEEGGTWHEGRGEDDDPYIVAWNTAYDDLPVIDFDGAAALSEVRAAALQDAEALDRLAVLVRLPEWQIDGSGADWIAAVADIVSGVRDTSEALDGDTLAEVGFDPDD